jgi:hypothetical protein
VPKGKSLIMGEAGEEKSTKTSTIKKNKSSEWRNKKD